MSGSPPVIPDLEVPEGCFDGADRRGPLFPYTPIPALGAAYLATTAISAALYSRARIGVGQQVHTSQLQGSSRRRGVPGSALDMPMHPAMTRGSSTLRGMRGMFECADGRWVCYSGCLRRHSYWAPPQATCSRRAAKQGPLRTIRPESCPIPTNSSCCITTSRDGAGVQAISRSRLGTRRC